ncbi:MAG: hypothetical protein AAB439_02205 [Patescibacteria group bacterium]
MEWNKGDILYGRKGSDAIHPIVFLDGHDDSYFVGVMITSAPQYADNIPMLEEHFEQNDLQGNPYEVRFKDSHLVEARLLKRLEWRPFRKVGELTPSGVAFVEAKTHEQYPIVWEEYLLNTSTQSRQREN